MAEELIRVLEKFPLVDSLKFTTRVETADKTLRMMQIVKILTAKVL